MLEIIPFYARSLVKTNRPGPVVILCQLIKSLCGQKMDKVSYINYHPGTQQWNALIPYFFKIKAWDILNGLNGFLFTSFNLWYANISLFWVEMQFYHIDPPVFSRKSDKKSFVTFMCHHSIKKYADLPGSMLEEYLSLVWIGLEAKCFELKLWTLKMQCLRVWILFLFQNLAYYLVNYW